MIVAPGWSFRISRAKMSRSWSPQRMRPRLSTTPMRSASPSRPMPRSAPQVPGHCRVGMMVGKAAVDVAVQRDDLGAQAAVELGGGDAAGAVAAVDDDAQLFLQPDIVQDVLQILGQDVLFPDATRRLGGKRPGDGEAVDLLDLVAVQGGGAEHDLETVVFAGIVRCGDDHGAPEVVAEGGIVDYRGRHQPQVDHLQAVAGQSAAEQLLDARRAGPAVHADGDLLLALAHVDGGDGHGDAFHCRVGQLRFRQAPDVIFPEDRFIEHGE